MQLSQHPPMHRFCGHGDISAINLLIISPAGCSCLNIRWYTTSVGLMTVITPILSMYLSTTSTVFTPAGYVNILNIYGRPMQLETDHKPLIAIFGKALNYCSAWLHRIQLNVQKIRYTHQLHTRKIYACSRWIIMCSNSRSYNENWTNSVWRWGSSVSYWPRPSCQKKKSTCVNNWCIQSKISRGNLDCQGVELSANCDAHRK